MTIETKPLAEADISQAKHIYVDAFPPEERRPWDDIVRRHHADNGAAHPRFSLLGIYANEFAGFITIWRFDAFDYVEHFVIAPEKRSGGIGAKAIASILAGFSAGRAVVLEAEHANQSPMAARRLDFYRRCGFTAHEDFEYIQPPYAPGLPEVPLMLLSANHASSLNLNEVAATIHHEVYGRTLP